MYLVSLYFDNESEIRLQRLINRVSEKCGNNFMTYNNVPPHITIASFESDNEEKVIYVLDRVVQNIFKEKITWASIGIFKSSVIFLSPVLNEYLQNISLQIHKGISLIDNISINKYYLPFNWMPHTTIAKKLSREELIAGIQELEKHFTIFSGIATRIALSKTNPYKDIIVWNLYEK